MGWTSRDVVRRWEGSSTGRFSRLPADALRGPTTLEQHALPAAIVACLGALALIQVILTWS